MDPARLLELFLKNKISFFCGVPDSLLKHFTGVLQQKISGKNHVITANEGGAIALAAGHHLATGEVPLVYLQNSGYGNAINPLLSLADPLVFGVPILLLVGWRGEPGKKDAPQHLKQGLVTEGLLEAMGHPWKVMPQEPAHIETTLEELLNEIRTKEAPGVLLVPAGTIQAMASPPMAHEPEALVREAAITAIAQGMPSQAVVVSTTGHISRELYESRNATGQEHERDFLNIGSMGHASQIAMGITLARPEQDVYCLDGDGALLMHLGGLAIIGAQDGLENFKYIVLNNGVHGSVGGQPTVGHQVQFTQIASGCGFRWVRRVEAEDELTQALEELKQTEGPCFLEIVTTASFRKNLGRPTQSPQEIKNAFMGYLAK